MDKYEEELDNVCKYLAKPIKLIALQELVEKNKNGIYISNEQTKELLEDVERLKYLKVNPIQFEAFRNVYNKLIQTLDRSD